MLSATHGVAEPLFYVLLIAAVLARLLTTELEENLGVSASFLCGMLAVGFLDPLSAFLIPVVAVGVGWLVERYRWQALIINWAGSATPTALAAVAFEALALDQDGALFPIVLGLFGAGVLIVNGLIVAPLMAVLDGRPVRATIGVPRDFYPALGINIVMTAALAALYAQTGIATIAFVMAVILAFAYMMRLVVVARDRTRQYANLSWGVLSSLIRTLDERDKRAARHCAAVAKFSRDIAAHVGMGRRDQELAHTAGLLHDIGRFALSDRVMEREGRLSEEDWAAIRRHPAIGADLLKDVGVYGPVADIVLCHHERIDGRGYPRGLTGDEIPEIARIVAVAEVYDTLTAPDTYRTQMNSFEALTELRRVAGRQLDARFVEALAELLAGQGTAYRHADDADYDAELDIERRMNEAAAPTS
ncbi:MAG: HD domain-containing protein [Actinobacteria bacterium]|nr:MAG: HD domain-containing protein [Actinomycetota bacterium]